MTGYGLLTEGLRLMGIGEMDENIKIIGLTLVNTVICDLGFAPIGSLSENIGISSGDAVQTLIFGVATLICNAMGDTDGRNAMSGIYSQKLAAYKGRINKVRDVMPKGEYYEI
jgi:hypothetical protein